MASKISFLSKVKSWINLNLNPFIGCSLEDSPWFQIFLTLVGDIECECCIFWRGALVGGAIVFILAAWLALLS